MSARDRLRRADTTVLAVAATVLVGLLARLVLLGDRVAHFDEGRVGYWILHQQETGTFSYRYIIHGPLIQHVNRWLFGVAGANDFTARLPIAVVGALLPLVVLLFRGRLRDDETIAAALFLAFNPLLLYYSRFFRSTMLVAAFMTGAFAVGLYAVDERHPHLLPVAFGLVALGFGAKENAVVYLLCWLGAGALLLDFGLMAPPRDGVGIDRLRGWYADRREHLAGDAGRRAARRWGLHTLAGVVVFLLLTLVIYAPRTAGQGVGLWNAVANPGQFPALLEATWADIETGLEYWFGGSTDPGCGKDNIIDGYLCYMGRLLQTLAGYAAPLMLLAVFGFGYERYATDRPRPLVMFAGYWGFVSVVGYPLGTDIYGAWIAVNMLVPLAVPAAVGLAVLAHWGREALAEGDDVGAALAGVVLLIVAAQVGWAALGGVYLSPQSADNEMVQYAQPAGDFRPVLDDLDRAAADTEGTVVLFYGSELANPPDQGGGIEPACTKMIKTLPLQWYLELADARGDCAVNESSLQRHLQENPPPVIIAHADQADQVERNVGGYEKRVYKLRTTNRPVAFFVAEEYA